MNRDREQFAEAGAPLVVIGQGTPANAAAFRRDFGLDIEILVDTDRLAYKAAGTKVGGVRELLGPRTLARGLSRALRSRVVQGKTIGHPAQLGGLMLVTPDSGVAWAHVSADASDYPPNAEVIDAVKAALERFGRPTTT